MFHGKRFGDYPFIAGRHTGGALFGQHGSMTSPNLLPKQKYTFKDFEREYPGERVCMEWLAALLSVRRPLREVAERSVATTCSIRPQRWPPVWHLRSPYHPTSGTIFHKSSTSLRTWFHAIFLMSQTRCGISAIQLMRETGVTYKAA